MIRKAIIPAAGLGTRFLPATKASPKEMLPIVNKPAIQFIVEEAVASGIEDILIITGRGKRAIEDHFDRSMELEEVLEARGRQEELERVRSISRLASIHYIRQREPGGLGDAVLCARAFVDGEPFALLLGDEIVDTPPGTPPCTRQLMEQYGELGDPVIGVQTVQAGNVSRYGIVRTVKGTVRPGEILPLFDMVEKPPLVEAPSRIAMMGRYVLDGSVFDRLAQTPRGAQGELQLTDALRRVGGALWGYGFEGVRFDVGHPLGLLEANLTYALRDPRLRDRLLPVMELLLLKHQKTADRGRAL